MGTGKLVPTRPMARENRDSASDAESPTARLAPANKAVSPVLGVVIIAALAVIMAAIIGTFAVTVGTNVDENAMAAVNVACDTGAPGEVTVTWTGTQNADELEIKASGEAYAFDSFGILENVGETNTFRESATPYSDDQTATVVVVAKADDTETVVANRDCEI